MKQFANGLHRVNSRDTKTYNHNPYPEGFEKVSVSEGHKGEWRVTHFTVTEENVGLENLRLIRDGYHQRVIPPGSYTRLCYGRSVVMSDTPAEAHEHSFALYQAKGDVLLNGLGLGFFLAAVLKKPEVSSVTVIEKSTEVIDLVAAHYTHPKVTIINADALVWRPPTKQRFGFVWHDIWANICDDNKSEMSKLKRAYGKRTITQACWSEEYL